MSQDFYEILGVSRTSSDGDIKSAYRKLAMQYHPDKNPGDVSAEVRFKEITMAYEVLKDPNKRAQYDRFGPAAFNGSGRAADGFDFNFTTSFSDLFEEMFGEFAGGGGGRRGSTRLQGADLRYNLTITLEEAFRGKKTDISLSTLQACGACEGTGTDEGSSIIDCPTCKGAGRIRASQGFFTIQRTCHTCQGGGKIVENPCSSCGGTGREKKEKDLSVNIPPGVEEGTRIRVAGEGEAGMQGGPPGDLYIFISIQQHPLFLRSQSDLFCRMPIPMTTATLGGEVEVPLIDGAKAKITLPEGTQSGAQFRLKGKGMPEIRSKHRGDMYVEAIVEIPKNLNKKQKELLQEFANACPDNHPEHKGFLDKVKAFWDKITDEV